MMNLYCWELLACSFKWDIFNLTTTFTQWMYKDLKIVGGNGKEGNGKCICLHHIWESHMVRFCSTILLFSGQVWPTAKLDFVVFYSNVLHLVNSQSRFHLATRIMQMVSKQKHLSPKLTQSIGLSVKLSQLMLHRSFSPVFLLQFYH